MYEHQGLQDIFFIMLYGGATWLAILSCCYLLLTRGNLFLSDIKPSRSLRRWSAAFMAAVAASHIWWVVLGIYWLTDDRLLRNIIDITLDRPTFVPLMMCVLLRLLQDRKRPLWPVAIAMVPILVNAITSIVTRNESFEWYTESYSILLGIVFTIYYIYSVRQYGRWLKENYADLEHKEVWQSLILLACILFVFVAYASNEGALATEYLAQVNTLIIIGFVLWRVETLQQLDAVTKESAKEAVQLSASDNVEISVLLRKYLVDPQLYLQHDLTLQQMAVIIGTNRTYLSNYFAECGLTYNSYINKLRVQHFIRLYHEAVASKSMVTAKALASSSGFRSYVTFGAAFKKYTGFTVTEWMRKEEQI